MPDKTIHSRFSASSSTYDRHSNIQDQVAGRVMELISDQPHVDRILELGCGTGRLTQKVRSRFVGASITAVDLSDAMVGQAKINLDECNSIDWVVSDVCDYVADRRFPLILSSSSLHWVTPIDRALHAIDRLIEPGGHIVLAIMLHDTLGELHDARLRVAPHKPPQSRLPSLSDVVESSRRLGWQARHQSQKVFTVRHASARELLVAIHQQGLTGGSVSRSHLPLNRGELASLIKDYDSSYQDDSGSVIASFQVGFLQAVKVGCSELPASYGMGVLP